MERSEKEWKKLLSPEQYKVLREKATEKPFTGKLLDNKDEGNYQCTGCGNKLFSSDTKFDSGCGWLSFYDAIPGSIKFIEDFSHGMRRVEIVCSKCGGHLGHVFLDGPLPTGKRYCVNSVSLNFKKKLKN